MTDLPDHPYAALPARAFWRSAVVDADRAVFDGLHQPRWQIRPDTGIATLGSCFAQHIGRALARAGCSVLEAEPAPEVMTDAVAHAHGYRLFSLRTGNIYTARQLRQFLQDVIAGHVDPALVWDKAGRYVDALRPMVEPAGLASVAEVMLHRDYHLERSARMLKRAEVLIFTLGLTEAWADRATGRVYPVCPGVVAGRFDPEAHGFVNFTHAQVLEDLHAIHALLRRFNPGMRLILTVSPVPLTATASGRHVLEATVGSKSVLRAAVGEFVAEVPEADYFPSYELVTHPAAGGPWFEPNLRSVTAQGVARVMSVFLAAHGLQDGGKVLSDEGEQAGPDGRGPGGPVSADAEERADPADETVCEDLLLQAFAK